MNGSIYQSRVKCVLVLSGTIESIEELKRTIQDDFSINIIYQRLGVGFFQISETGKPIATDL